MESRTENSIKNIQYAFVFQLLYFISQFIVRKVFVLTLSSQCLGINGTFTGIISTISVMELGIGSAITFSLYKPLAQNDVGKISALLNLYRKLFYMIAGAILIIGLIINAFLTEVFPELASVPQIHGIFLIFVLDSVCSYILTYKQAVIQADQKQRIITFVRYMILLICNCLQLLCLLFLHSFVGYLLLKLASTIAFNLVISRLTDRMYPFLKQKLCSDLDTNTRKELRKNISAMIAHKTGAVVTYGTDNLLLALLSNVSQVGIYSNYLMVLNALRALYDMVFGAIYSSIGNLGATEGDDHLRAVFLRLNFAGSWLFYFSAVCLFILFQPFISCWVGEEFLFPQSIVLVIVCNFYVTGMRYTVNTFKDALGLFWYDRYKAFAESAVNLTVSILLTKVLGIIGIFLGTLISILSVSFWVEPLVLFRRRLHLPFSKFFIDYLINTLLTAIIMAGMKLLCGIIPLNGIPALAVYGTLCLIIPNLVFIRVHRNNENLKFFINLFNCRLRVLKTGLLSKTLKKAGNK